jgi:hypothetical protein
MESLSRTKAVLFIVVLTVISIFYITTLRQENDWGDDFGLYIRHKAFCFSSFFHSC